MPNQSKWGKQSFNYIISKYNEIAPTNPTLSVEEVVDKINKEHYPYGPRTNHPYKQWLKAIRAAKDYIALMRRNDEDIRKG